MSDSLREAQLPQLLSQAPVLTPSQIPPGRCPWFSPASGEGNHLATVPVHLGQDSVQERELSESSWRKMARQAAEGGRAELQTGAGENSLCRQGCKQGAASVKDLNQATVYISWACPLLWAAAFLSRNKPTSVWRYSIWNC